MISIHIYLSLLQPSLLGKLPPQKDGGCESNISKSPKSEMDLRWVGCLRQAFKDLTCVPSCIEPDPIPLDITKDLEGNWVPCLENEGGFLGVLILEPWDFGMFRWLDGKCGFQQLVERKRLYEFLEDLFTP